MSNNDNCVNTASEFEKFDVKSLLKLILQTLLGSLIPAIPIPTMLLAMGVMLRPGLSASKITSRTHMACSDAGIPMGDLAGEDNLFAKAIELTQGKMVDGITNDAVVDGVTQAGVNRVYVNTVGVLGPTTGDGVNLTPIKSQGIIS